MKTTLRIITCGAVALSASTASVLADTPSPREARTVEKHMRRGGRSLADIIRAAEEKSGGKAVCVELVDSEGRRQINRNWREQNNQKAADANGAAKDENKFDYRVTCLVNRSKLQDVYVCPQTGAVLMTSSTSRYGLERDSRRSPQNGEGDSATATTKRAHGEDDHDAAMTNPGQTLLASRIINLRAVNPQNNDLGDIEDIAMNPQNGDVVYLALARGGFIGIGTTMYAVPCDTVVNCNQDRMCLDISASALKDMKGFKNDEWPTQSDSHLTKSTNVANAARIAKVTDIYGKALYGADEKPLGEIEDLVVDIDARRIAYAIVTCDGGMIAVPASAIRHTEDKCVIDMTKERFLAMPKFRDDAYPNWMNQAWSAGVHRDFNVQPYWKDAKPSERGNVTMTTTND